MFATSALEAAIALLLLARLHRVTCQCVSPFNHANRNYYFFRLVDDNSKVFPAGCVCRLMHRAKNAPETDVDCGITMKLETFFDGPCLSRWDVESDGSSGNSSVKPKQFMCQLSRTNENFRPECPTKKDPLKLSPCKFPDAQNGHVESCGRFAVLFNEVCYALVAQPVSARTAHGICSTHGGQLAYWSYASFAAGAPDAVKFRQLAAMFAQVDPRFLQSLPLWVGLHTTNYDTWQWKAGHVEPFMLHQRRRFLSANETAAHVKHLHLPGNNWTSIHLWEDGFPVRDSGACAYLVFGKLRNGPCDDNRSFLCAFHRPFLSVDHFYLNGHGIENNPL